MLSFRELAIDKPGLRDRLMNLYLTLDAFPEVPDVLKRLKQAGLRTAILSNGSPRMLAAAVTAAGLGSLLDSGLSVETVARAGLADAFVCSGPCGPTAARLR